jgi:hypothetical protein
VRGEVKFIDCNGNRGNTKKLAQLPIKLFYLRLAKDLGKTVKQMLSEMGSRELTEWIAYYNMQAQDEKNAYLRADMERKLNG